MYLVDTNVISAGAPSKAMAQTELIDWMERNTDRLYLSVVTIAEIEDGIAKARREGARRKSAQLASWLETVLHLYSARILVLNIGIARLAGRLSDFARGRAHEPGFTDLVIAATARSHGLQVLTRNLRHFTILDVPAHDPFAELL
jgi:predicted nucleic acid-binding protein